ncbi:hypothetical protein [Komagataeibacter xylinus]|uniref:hypothetical protein n=1 Tax=Komagataeibacter xylinus TaxID=28448 RepID=UPI00280B2B02|nr:hypothetical protein [Komagataeibacter xylinus]
MAGSMPVAAAIRRVPNAQAMGRIGPMQSHRAFRVPPGAGRARPGLGSNRALAILAHDMSLRPDGARAAGDMAGACRVVADYSAAMTGRCTIEAYRRLTDLSSPG